ncbi:MAG TPA: HNH endonuclease [Ignavibacteriaceae bacterium]|nr:HNH endonuclease [Ignavibacteriaceae bacterium]
MGIQTNTGRTHFKKGFIPWNKGKICPATPNNIKASEAMRGVPQPKPEGYAELMRSINKPYGRKQNSDGRNLGKKLRVWRDEYVMVYKPEHPTSRKKAPDYGYVLEHRYIMELHLGRSLLPTEFIHHIDGNKSNNVVSNFVLCQSLKEHNRIHTEMEMFVEKLIREGKVKYNLDKKEFEYV